MGRIYHNVRKLIILMNISHKTLLTQFIFPICIVCIGTINSLGSVVQQPKILNLGYALAAAPLPVPFTDMYNKQESFSYSYMLLISDKNITYTVPIMSSAIRGTHKYKIAFMSTITTLPNHHPLKRVALEYILCQESKRIDGFPHTLNREYWVQIQTSHATKQTLYSHPVTCPLN